MGAVYRLPKVVLDSGVPSFNTTNPSESQLTVFNTVVSNGIAGYRVNTVLYNWVTNYYVTINDDVLITFFYTPSIPKIGYCIKSIGGVINIAYDRSNNPKTYGYEIFTTQYGITDYQFDATYLDIDMLLDYYPTLEEAHMALDDTPLVVYPITYRPTNCSFPNAPTEAAVGDEVVVPVTFPDGYGIVNNSDIYVTNNGVIIPSTYSNGQLTFTMPDPS